MRKERKSSLLLRIIIIGLLLYLVNFTWQHNLFNIRNYIGFKLNIQDQLDLSKYQAKDNKEKAIKEDLKKLQEQQYRILEGEIHKIGKLEVLQGTEQYQLYMPDKTVISSREIFMDLKYTFIICTDFNQIKIKSFENGVLTIEKPTVDNLTLNTPTLNHSESEMKSKASLFAKKYNAQEINTMLTNSTEQVTTSILNNEQYWNEAMDSLEGNIIDHINNIAEATNINITEIRFE